MNRTLTQPAPAGVHRAADAVRVAVVVVLAVAAMALALRLVETPATIDRLSIVNPSTLELDLATAGAPSGDWVPAGSTDPHTVTSFDEVLDHGDRWWFRATSGGRVATWQVPRAQLVRDGWRVVIPPGVIDALRTGHPSTSAP